MEVIASVGVDFRHIVPKIQAEAKGKVLASVNDPGVRDEINRQLLAQIEDKIPVDTGALAMSPYMRGGRMDMGLSHRARYQYYRKFPIKHFAHGDMRDDIVFDPYTSRDEHYAVKLKGFYPNRWINASKKRVYNTVRDIIVKEVNKRDR